MGIVIGILTALEIVAAVLLIGIILIQQTKHGGGLSGLGGSVTEAVFGATAGNVLTKITVILASVFLGITLLLVILTAHRREARSVVERTAAGRKFEMPVPTSAKAAVTETAIPAEPIKDAKAAVQAAVPAVPAAAATPVSLPAAPAAAPAPGKPAAPAADQPRK
jgi:preprotein translocase subunit SecG